MAPSANAPNAVRQQPTMKTCSTHLVVAVVALLGPAAAWAGNGGMPANARLLLAATDVVQNDAATEAERMHQRIRQRQQTPVPPAQAPYGIGYEARKGMPTEDVEAESRVQPAERIERPERVEAPERAERPVRIERVERVERPGVERAGRGGR